jgi:hypothetical protein
MTMVDLGVGPICCHHLHPSDGANWHHSHASLWYRFMQSWDIQNSCRKGL